jgi:hypothetical protein
MNRLFLLFALCAVAAAGCSKRKTPRLSWNVTLSSTDTAPYGASLAYGLTKHYFPDASLEALPSRFRYTSMDDDMRYQATGAALLVAVGLHFRLGDDELDELLGFVRAGNEAIIFCSQLDEKLEKKLRARANSGHEESPLNGDWNKGEENLGALMLEAAPARRFGYFGRGLRGHFALDSIEKPAAIGDTSVVGTTTGSGSSPYDNDWNETYDVDGDTAAVPEVLGRAQGKPNFIRYSFGGGHLSVHLAPLTLSNYFLLQKNNRQYLDGVWSSLPPNIAAVYWHEYFKRRAESSSLGILWRHPATRWALLLTILALSLYVLFESRRRQRIVPIVVPPQNTSVAFVETVGRLYHARGDHRNLAEKMVQHFLEGVRNAHGLPTTELNDAFAEALSRKSGCAPREAAAATFMAREVRTGNFAVTEEYIHRLYATLKPFHATTQA